MAEENERGDEYNKWERGKSGALTKRMKGLAVAESMDSSVDKLILFNSVKCPKDKLLLYFEKLIIATFVPEAVLTALLALPVLISQYSVMIRS